MRLEGIQGSLRHPKRNGEHVNVDVAAPHNFKALSCTPTYVSSEFLHLGIYIFFPHADLAKITNKFESNDIKFQSL